MRVLIAGGKLQGVEAAYLAQQCGWEVMLADRKADAPAVGLCDRFLQLDILEDADRLMAWALGVDFIIPAVEDYAALEQLKRIGEQLDVPVACDLASYRLSSSKKESDRFFKENSIPAPRYWPDCDFPVIAKPSSSSGSRGVKKIQNSEELKELLRQEKLSEGDYLVQEFLAGDSSSIEVIGFKNGYLPLQVTDLEMDSLYDCKRVIARTKLKPAQVEEFRGLAVKIAGLLQLTGIMDLEVINHHGLLKVLEIDARLPSQTPTAVYRSTGINVLPLLYQAAVRQEVDLQEQLPREQKGVVYEHIMVTREKIETLGEHIMSQAGPLQYRTDFFGADEALTSFTADGAPWVATLIVTAADRQQAWKKRCRVIANIKEQLGLPYQDSLLEFEPA